MIIICFDVYKIIIWKKPVTYTPLVFICLVDMYLLRLSRGSVKAGNILLSKNSIINVAFENENHQ